MWFASFCNGDHVHKSSCLWLTENHFIQYCNPNLCPKQCHFTNCGVPIRRNGLSYTGHLIWIDPFDKVAHCEYASYALYLCIGTTSNLRGHLTIQNAKLKSFRRIETGELLCNQVSRRPIFISSLPMQKNNFVKFLNVSEVRVPFEWIVLFRFEYQQSRH